jgi:hypothetical protein
VQESIYAHSSAEESLDGLFLFIHPTNMKYLILSSIALFMTSCAPVNFYQLYKVSTDSGSVGNENIVFQSEDYKIEYNFWDEGGDAGFYFYNNTDADIHVDLTKSFFVLNDVAHEYFRNKTYTESQTKESSVSAHAYSYHTGTSKVSQTASSAATFGQKPGITIPKKTRVKIAEFHISQGRQVSCELARYPKVRDIRTVKFDTLSSPFRFYNLISYTTGNQTKRIENHFFISELTNLPEQQTFTYIDRSPCGRKLDVPQRVFKDIAPDKFYVKYMREQ